MTVLLKTRLAKILDQRSKKAWAMLRYERLDNAGVTLVLAIAPQGAPRLLYWGAALAPGADLAAWDALQAQSWREAQPDVPVPASIFPVHGFGWMGPAALSGCAQGGDGAVDWGACSVRRIRVGPQSEALVITLRDSRLGLRVELEWCLDARSGVLASHCALHNDGALPFALAGLAALSMPLPDWAEEILAFPGHWAREGQAQRLAAPIGQWAQINRSGRTGFSGATIALLESRAGEESGRVLALHLAWSGSHRLSVESSLEGPRFAQLEALLEPGEIDLAPGASHHSPSVYACFSDAGLNGVRARFHAFVRRAVLPPPANSPRRVHFNSWEGVYFDFDLPKLKALAEGAAALGAERFVLDDGWFSGRRNDRAGLGDWQADSERFPEGLDPLIAHVAALGMDFGLWVEPEMVNLDSALYRAHPDWCVHAPRAARPGMRNQLWLDLARAEVRDHVFGQLDALLRTHDIAYLKWDCNRTLFPAVSAGQAIVRGAYAVFDALRTRHPTLEIEACASGGARFDLEILKRASRVWVSDATDAQERARIQRWASLIAPLEVIGAHVGPSPNPITGRQLSMQFRAAVAVFGHMGIELDPEKLTPAEQETLRAMIALYKAQRGLLHAGRLHHWLSDDGVQAAMVVAEDGAQALALALRLEAGPAAQSAPLRLVGLDAGSDYTVELLAPWPEQAAKRLAQADQWRAPRVFSGAALLSAGITLPLSAPHTAWLIGLQRV